jgi:MYND finger
MSHTRAVIVLAPTQPHSLLPSASTTKTNKKQPCEQSILLRTITIMEISSNHRTAGNVTRCQASCPSTPPQSSKQKVDPHQQKSMKRSKLQLTPHTPERKPKQKIQSSSLTTQLQDHVLVKQRSFSSFVMPNDVQELFQDAEMVPHYVFEFPALTKTANFKTWGKSNTHRASLIIGMFMRAARDDEHLPSGINCCAYCLLGHQHSKQQLPVCPACLKQQYCNKKCQQKHWMFHKKYCEGCA